MGTRRNGFVYCCLLSGGLLLAAGCANSRGLLSRKPADPINAARERLVVDDLPRHRKPTAQMYADFAEVQFTSRNFPRAEHLYEQALHEDKKFALAYVGKARAQWAQQQAGKAEETLRLGLKHCPKSGAIWNEIGLLAASNKDYQQGAQAIQNAILFEPGNLLFVQNLAGMLAMQGKYDEAVKAYCRVMKPADAHYQVAGIMYSQGHKAQGLAMLRLAVQEDPSNAQAKAMLTQLSETSDQSILPVEFVTPERK